MKKKICFWLGMSIAILLSGCKGDVDSASDNQNQKLTSSSSKQESELNDTANETSTDDSYELDTQNEGLSLSKANTEKAHTISTNGTSYFAIKNDNTLWAWGYNQNGQLGNGTSTDLYGLQQTEPVFIMEDVEAVSTGGSGGNDHTLIIKTDGTLWFCGANIGTEGICSTPIHVMDDVISVCADNSCFAIQSDNSLWAWGNNSYGELGTGTTEKQPSPTKVLDNVVSVDSSGGNTFAIKTDGTLWAWGLNSFGELGNGTTEAQLSPVKILDDVAAVHAGYTHTCALKKDGTLWAWGGVWKNSDNQSVYEPMYLMDDVADITLEGASRGYVFALKNDGTLWRENSYFQIFYYTDDDKWILWDGTEEPKNQLADIAAIDGAGSGYVDLILKLDGTLLGRENFQLNDIKIY